MNAKKGQGSEVTVVIPARNEHDTIGVCVHAIRGMLEPNFTYDVIVVDDNSNDGTGVEARKAGASVIQAPNRVSTVAGLRNYGARYATGDIVVFLDADVVVAEPWGSRFKAIATEGEANGYFITGSKCKIPDNAGWIEKHWFAKKRDRSTYVGSGHMIISRSLFVELGGFDGGLVSGEDYDLCRRARRYGATVRADSNLVAIHLGFPKTVGEFARRELWHGAGDATSLRHLIRSKVAIAAIMFTGMLILLILGGITGQVALATTGVLGTLSIIVASGMIQFRTLSLTDWLVVVPLYSIYFLMRMAAIIRGVGRRATE